MSKTGIREKKIMQTSAVGIAANVLLAAFKAAVGAVAGSVSVILDAVNNLTDALSSVITVIGVRLARRKPDEKHPFGYGRIEYFSAMIIAAIILSTGVTSLIESVKKIISPEMPEFSIVTVIVIAAAVAVKFFLGRYVKAQGKKYNSDALVASGTDAGFDAIISAATLAGVVITLLFQITLDGYIGAVIALFIIKAGLEMLFESVGNVIGSRPDTETAAAIKQSVAEVPGVLGVYDLILHNYGPDSAIGSVHVEISDALSAADIHKLTKQIQANVAVKHSVFLTVGVYAKDSAHAAECETVNAIALSHPGVTGTHGVFFDDANGMLSFDAEIDFTVKDKASLAAALAAETEKALPGYSVNVNLDADYSG